MERNNDVVRQVAAKLDVSLVETATLAQHGDLFLDDCHANPEGHDRRAQMMFEAIIKDGLLPGAAP